MFDRIAPIYDAMNTVMTAGLDARWRRATIAALRLRPGERVLDVGTGTGRLALAATPLVEPGPVVGLDASAAMLARARRTGASTPSVTWIHGDAMALPFAPGSFDAVTVAFTVRNLPDFNVALREMARVLRPGKQLSGRTEFGP